MAKEPSGDACCVHETVEAVFGSDSSTGVDDASSESVAVGVAGRTVGHFNVPL